MALFISGCLHGYLLDFWCLGKVFGTPGWSPSSLGPVQDPTTLSQPRRPQERLWLLPRRRGARFTRHLSHLARPSLPRALFSHHLQPREPRSAEAMSSPAPSSRKQHRTDAGFNSRPRVPPTGASTSRVANRHASSSAGSRAREQDGLPCSRDFSPTIPISLGHAYSALAQTPPSDSKVRSRAGATLPCNEVSPGLRIGGLGRRIQAHQSARAPSTTSWPPLAFAQVAPASLNEPPSLSSSLTSAAPSLAGPPTPKSKHSPFRARTRSAFVTPSASFASLRSDLRSCEAEQLRCERHTPSPSPLSHASREPRPGSHR